MQKMPKLYINRKILKNNGELLVKLCHDYGIAVAGVIKGANGMGECGEILHESGCREIASSRMSHLRTLKEKSPQIVTMLIRIPMVSEIEELVDYVDISLISEMTVMEEINKVAGRKGKKKKIILMRDLGDLREGILDRTEFVAAAIQVEQQLSNLELLGIGTNLSCYGSIIPTTKNLTDLVDTAEEVEKKIGRSLDVISGGGTTVIPLLLAGGVPCRINHLRLGESILSTLDLPMLWNCQIAGLSPDAFVLKAELIEVNEKPTFPIGERGVAAFGKKKEYVDRGIRKRAIVAIGNMDLGDASRILPKDPNIKVLGASGDHTILDIQDCEIQYKVGDVLEFNLLYQGIVFSSLSPMVKKEFIK